MSDGTHSTGQEHLPVPQGTAVVCGGGVAGIAAAIDLAEHGWAVTLIESRKQPAEGAPSTHARRTVMRACTSLVGLYERLGVADRVKWDDALNFVDPEQPALLHELEGDDLPAPIHLLRPLLKFTLLTTRQRFTVARGLLGVMQAGSTRRARRHHNDESFANWLASNGQDGDLIERFWSPITVSACSAPPEHIAAGLAFQVFQEALLATPDGYNHGMALCPMTELFSPARKKIEHAGGAVLLNTEVTAVRVEHGKAVGVTTDIGKTLDADAVIVAVPVDKVAGLVPGDLAAADPRFAPIDALDANPYVGVDLYVKREDDRRIFPASHAFMPGRPVHRIVDHGTAERPGHGKVRRLYAVLAEAHDASQTSDDDLAALAMSELRRLNGLEGGAGEVLQLVEHRVVKENRTSFSVAPGVDVPRPATSGETANLYLAGDWTDTGWPGTMEGAARSGVAAASAARGEQARKEARAGTLLYRVLAG